MDDLMLKDLGVTRSEIEHVVRYGRWADDVNRLERLSPSKTGRTSRPRDAEGKKLEQAENSR
jgi:hypothetical protein